MNIINNGSYALLTTLKQACKIFTAMLVLFSLGLPAAHGAVDMFLKIEGIDGESQADGHKDEIDIVAWNWGMTNSTDTTSGGGGGAGKVSFEDITVYHFFDKATPQLMLAVAQGKHIPSGKITVQLTAGNQKPFDYVVVEMTDIVVTSSFNGGSADEGPLVEQLTLNFAEVKVTYRQLLQDGSIGPPTEFQWNIVTNAPN